MFLFSPSPQSFVDWPDANKHGKDVALRLLLADRQRKGRKRRRRKRRKSIFLNRGKGGRGGPAKSRCFRK